MDEKKVERKDVLIEVPEPMRVSFTAGQVAPQKIEIKFKTTHIQRIADGQSSSPKP